MIYTNQHDNGVNQLLFFFFLEKLFCFFSTRTQQIVYRKCNMSIRPLGCVCEIEVLYVLYAFEHG